MHSEDRLIHFSIELIHQPGPLKVPALQKLYYDLSQTRAAYDSIDVSAPGRGRFYSRRGKKTQSLAVFLPDRVAVIEEWLDTALSDCFTKVQEIIPRALEALEVPGFVAQTATLRSTFALTHFDDAPRVSHGSRLSAGRTHRPPFSSAPSRWAACALSCPRRPSIPATST